MFLSATNTLKIICAKALKNNQKQSNTLNQKTSKMSLEAFEQHVIQPIPLPDQ